MWKEEAFSPGKWRAALHVQTMASCEKLWLVLKAVLEEGEAGVIEHTGSLLVLTLVCDTVTLQDITLCPSMLSGSCSPVVI